MPRPKKKLILFLVEGSTDEEALLRPIDNFLSDVNEELELGFVIVHGDLTSDYKNTPENIVRKINDKHFRPYFSSNEFYYPKDVVKVIHLVDTDGCFIPDENLLVWESGETVEFPYYSPPYIYHKNRDFLIKRNETKAANLKYLTGLDSIKVVSKKIPYEVYYFSSNLDHCLNGEENLNLSVQEKIERAGYFADANENDSALFLRFFNDYTPKLDELTYEKSWDFIAQDVQSLQRYSNFYLGLKKLQDEYNQ